MGCAHGRWLGRGATSRGQLLARHSGWFFGSAVDTGRAGPEGSVASLLIAVDALVAAPGVRADCGRALVLCSACRGSAGAALGSALAVVVACDAGGAAASCCLMFAPL